MRYEALLRLVEGWVGRGERCWVEERESGVLGVCVVEDGVFVSVAALRLGMEANGWMDRVYDRHMTTLHVCYRYFDCTCKYNACIHVYVCTHRLEVEVLTMMHINC
jgi:hypothetical protein